MNMTSRILVWSLVAAYAWLLWADGPVLASFPGTDGLIAYGHHRIFVLEPDGTRRRLTHDAHFDNDPAWTSDGKKLVFVCTSSNEPRSSNLCSIHGDGTHKRHLTRTNVAETQPFWSPSGKRIVFVRHKAPGEISIIRRDGSDEHCISSDGTTCLQGTFPQWSPDGESIAYSGASSSVAAGASTDIWIVQPGGSQARDLTNSGAAEGQPAWSPDGRRLAYTRSGNGNSSRIWVMSADGENRKRLTKFGDGARVVTVGEKDRLPQGSGPLVDSRQRLTPSSACTR
jgi:TolB protein